MLQLRLSLLRYENIQHLLKWRTRLAIVFCLQKRISNINQRHSHCIMNLWNFSFVSGVSSASVWHRRASFGLFPMWRWWSAIVLRISATAGWFFPSDALVSISSDWYCVSVIIVGEKRALYLVMSKGLLNICVFCTIVFSTLCLTCYSLLSVRSTVITCVLIQILCG